MRYQLAAVAAGGPASIVATYLLAVYHSSSAIALYMAAAATVSVVATLMIRERSRQDLSIEYDERPPAPAGTAALPAPLRN
jgi:hypothetical protein